MKVLIVDSGGRGYALARHIAASELVDEVHTSPGNGRTAQFGKNVPISATDVDNLCKYADEEKVDLVVVGQEDPLALGIGDPGRCSRPVFGPCSYGAKAESSKFWAKTQYDIGKIKHATPWNSFTDPAEAHNWLDEVWGVDGFEYVIKADGLAQGKGVDVPSILEDAHRSIEEMMVQKRNGVMV